MSGYPGLAPFEPVDDYEKRMKSSNPYDKPFIRKCRRKAREYDANDRGLRDLLLEKLFECVPDRYRGEVFEGIDLSGLEVPDHQGKKAMPKKAGPEQMTLFEEASV